MVTMHYAQMAGTSQGGIVNWSKNNLVTIAGIAGAVVVGYAIYYDHKRRSSPDYKQKIREKRRARAAASNAGGRSASGTIDVPNPMNPADMQAFFLQEVQVGEELMAAGNLEEGAEHIANAVVICGHGNQLLSIFQQTLAPDHFALILEKLPTAKQRLADRFNAAADIIEQADAEGAPLIQEMMADEDVE